ncbi:hypothetical protein [Pseudomonas maioricensis]|uniref:hypothetical protein n=1 Tax=Pseudomonas maioricensis TaxID=1766623 RepID=UPI001FAB9380|nr:hypothetical protein [Pseudomonas sp. S25]
MEDITATQVSGNASNVDQSGLLIYLHNYLPWNIDRVVIPLHTGGGEPPLKLYSALTAQAAHPVSPTIAL